MTRRRLRDYWTANPTAQAPLAAWLRITNRQAWQSFSDVRATFNSADYVGGKVVFNIGGNNYRLIVSINYRNQLVFVRWLGTHAEYDRIDVAEL